MICGLDNRGHYKVSARSSPSQIIMLRTERDASRAMIYSLLERVPSDMRFCIPTGSIILGVSTHSESIEVRTELSKQVAGLITAYRATGIMPSGQLAIKDAMSKNLLPKAKSVQDLDETFKNLFSDETFKNLFSDETMICLLPQEESLASDKESLPFGEIMFLARKFIMSPLERPREEAVYVTARVISGELSHIFIVNKNNHDERTLTKWRNMLIAQNSIDALKGELK